MATHKSPGRPEPAEGKDGRSGSEARERDQTSRPLKPEGRRRAIPRTTAGKGRSGRPEGDGQEDSEQPAVTTSAGLPAARAQPRGDRCPAFGASRE